MKYADVRAKIGDGDVIATTHTAWRSWYDLQVQAVRVGTQSEYCHVGLVWKVAGRLFVVESVAPVVRLVPLRNLRVEGFYWLPLGVPMARDELRFALSRVGNGQYSKWQAFLAGLRRLRIGADDIWSCAEFVIECRKLSGVQLGDKATPAAVVRELQARGAGAFLVKG